jgi:hypothetical protein
LKVIRGTKLIIIKIKMRQLKLNNYIKITAMVSKINKYFIYIPEERRAIYINRVEEDDKFIIRESGLELYIRERSERKKWKPQRNGNISIPFVKSNLQKGIRRKDEYVVYQSILWLLSEDKKSLLRRLPIIMIEDTKLFEQLEIIIWLMITYKEYELKEEDVEILLCIVKNMIEENDYFDYETLIEDTKFDDIEKIQNCSLRSLAYREKYGGMKGDMIMINKAIHYYLKNENLIGKIKHYDMRHIMEKYQDMDSMYIDIIWEAIDFHCYPFILTNISKKTGYARDMIKQYIWYSDSAWNERKDNTKITTNEYKRKKEWTKINKELEKERNKIVDEL